MFSTPKLPILGATALLLIFNSDLQGQDLAVDFQPSGGTTAGGYSPFEESNQVIPSSPSSYSAFGTTVSIGLSVANLPDTPGDFRAVTRNGSSSDPNNDWIGVDTRNGGNNVTLTITVSDLPAGTYEWSSTHHDGGSGASNGNLSGAADYIFTDASGPTTVPNGIDFSTQNLGDPVSTLTRAFTTTGNDVSMSLVMDTGQGSGANNIFAFIGTLSITQTAPPEAPTDISLSASALANTVPIGTTVGTLMTTDPTPSDSFTYSLVGGIGSADNGQFAISGSTLVSDRDLSGFPSGTVLSLRIRTTDLESDSFEKIFLINLVADSDGDGLDDVWELTYFPNLTTATGSGNNDTDTLTNLQEQAEGTNPTLADTDADGIDDDNEVNTHGSDPQVADTDGDGISDGDEVSNSNGFVTDPTLEDTDGDGFSDALEIAEGTDPTNTADFPDTLLPLRLNEILARNSSDLADGDGDREDWIEIYNPNPTTVNLDGYFLTDDQFLLTQWNFPNVTIPANDYLIVFASGKNTVDGSGNPHTNFQLSGGGEFLAIVRPNGTTIDDSFSSGYPEQFTDISYGEPSAGGAAVFFQTTTPGAVNGSTPYLGVVKDTNFSIDRGFYNAPFQLTISSATPGANIRYTTDGSKPSPTSGSLYTGPIDITTTTPLRAIAYFSDWLPTNIDTHTYIFVDDVVQQPNDPAGWRSDWTFDSQVGQIVTADYEMDARVVNNTNGLGVHTVHEALLDIPTVSLTMLQEDVTGANQGIYTKPKDRREFEGSVEYILPDGADGFQENCIVETHGNSSRTPFRMQKHSLRLTFSSEVGVSKLNYPLFPESDIEEFNKLVLRACFTDSWALNTWSAARYRPNDAQYIRDVWMKDSLGDMGQPTSYGNFVHLYVNGVYFGLHNFTERLEDDWYADHLGGAKEDWLINKDLSAPPARWATMMSILNGNITSNSVFDNAKPYLDMENYIDYMLLHLYADSEDWPHHNGYAAANANSGDGKFRFFVWDQEIALDKFSWNRYSDSRGGGAPFQRLRLNEEFRLQFADRVHKHMFNGGALSEQASIDRYLNRANQIDKAIVAESARWGDVQETTPYGDTPSSSTNVDADYYPPLLNNPTYFTREQHWVVERDNVTGHYIPTLHDESDSRSIINELRSNNLYPSIDPPAFSQHGGPVPNNFNLGISTSAGNIYFTTDGSDPRSVGGGVNPTATMLTGGIVVDDLLDFEETGWLYLDTGVAQSDSEVVVGNGSYGVSDWKHPNFDDSSWGSGQAMLGYGTIGSGASTITINQPVDFGPSSSSKYITTYFRKPFVVTGASDYLELDVSIIRDDGAIVYLNGKEVGRSNLASGNRSFSDTASNASPEQEVVPLTTFVLSPGDLLEGTNILAIEVHQQSGGSSDMGIDATISASKPNSGGGSGATLTQTGPVRARALSNGEWSAMTEASFIVGTPASNANLVVSEIYYNPPGSLEDTEFIELMNSSDTETIDLTGVTLTGVSYAFPEGFTLAPLERVVVVKNLNGFSAAYNTAGLNIAPGDFGSTGLANGGEEIAVLAQDGTTDIQRFEYDDKSPWPESADGPGFSLVLIAPETNPDHTLPTNWRPSVVVGGTPGGTDLVAFAGDPDADADGDLLTAFLEHAMGTSEAGSEAEQWPTGSAEIFGADRYLTISFQRNLAADDVIYQVEVGSDLDGWTTDSTFVSSVNNSDGTARVVYRSNVPMSANSRQFIRLRVISR